MSSDDEADAFQITLQAAVDLAEDLPSATPSQAASPATRRANRELIIQLQERMILAGQLEPVSISDELENISTHLGELAPQPLPPAARESAETAMASIKRVIRKRVSDEEIDTFLEELDSAVNAISTPTSSQPRDPEILERSKQAFDELAADMRRKKLLAPRTRKPNKNKVRAPVSLSRCNPADHLLQRQHFVPATPPEPPAPPPAEPGEDNAEPASLPFFSVQYVR